MLALPWGALAATAPAAGGPAWSTTCAAGERGTVCTVSAEAQYANSLGGIDGLTLSVRVDDLCTSIHVSLDRRLDTRQPASLAIDAGPPQAFYSSAELAGLARDVDSGGGLGSDRPEFAAFARDVAIGRFASRESAAAELVARFAYVKDEDRLGIGCPSAARLLPVLRAGRRLTLAFSAEAARSGALYHWPQLTRREVDLPLDGLASALDALRTAPGAAQEGTPHGHDQGRGRAPGPDLKGARQGASGNPAAATLP